jgi:hypothetical protein
MIELVAILALIIACRRLGRAVREPRRVEVHVYHHGLPGGSGERLFFEYPTNPNSTIGHGADTPCHISRPPLTTHWFH